MLNKKTVDDIQVKGKRVLVRCDFNVPMKDGVITDENRIVAALPTIKKLIADGGKVILCSHLGKPKNGPEDKFSLKAAAARLAELVSAKVTFVPSDVVADDVRGCGQGRRRVGRIHDRLHLYGCRVSAQWSVGSPLFGYAPGQCRVVSGGCGGGYADLRFFLWILGRCCFCRCFYRHPVLCIAATVRRIDTQTARASG